MRLERIAAAAVGLLLAAAPGAPSAQDGGPRLALSGATFTKWLYGSQRTEGGLQSFVETGGNYGDSGQGTELELLLDAVLSRQVEVRARLESRFNQNYWTTYGGFYGSPAADCDQGGACGEFSPYSSQYVKLRGAQVVLTPGYGWIDSATIGSNDFGQFDPFVIGRIRYLDRDSASGLLFQGSALGRAVTWDVTRISLPRVWAGPGFSTGAFSVEDATYGGQVRWTASPLVDLGAIGQYTLDDEVDPADANVDDGVALRPRFRNGVVGAKAGVHLGPWADLRAAVYRSWSRTYGGNGAPPFVTAPFPAVAGFSPVPYGAHSDFAWRLDWGAADPLGVGLSLSVQAFWIGAGYVSMLAARRESDVLLTEGWDAAFALPGVTNGAFTGAPLNRTRIGWGGWDGTAQQVATINVDNGYTDFDEPLAQTAIGWKGVTIAPLWQVGAVELGGEYSFIGYDTNWQAWGNPSLGVNESPYPTMEGCVGVLSYRCAYQPFQDRQTHLAAVRAKYTVELGRGVDVHGRAKYLRDTDRRMNDARFLPYEPDGVTRREYSPGHSTADLYPSGGAWKPFTSVADDDRRMDYGSFELGAGYPFTDDLYLSASYARYVVDLRDGNTAFQGYDGQQGWTSGRYDKHQLVLHGRYVLAGLELGVEGQYNFGTFAPKYYSDGGFVPQPAPADVAAQLGIPVGAPGFAGRAPGTWVRLDRRELEEVRVKAFMKARF